MFSYTYLVVFVVSFIENFGTHVITSVTIGGKDVIYVRQHDTSSLSTMEMKNYVQDIGNQRFSTTESLTSSGLLKYKDKASSNLFLLFHTSEIVIFISVVIFEFFNVFRHLNLFPRLF